MLTNLADIFRVLDLSDLLCEADFPQPDYMYRNHDHLVCCWEHPRRPDRLNAAFDLEAGEWFSFWWDRSDDDETGDFSFDATSKESIVKQAWAWAWEATDVVTR